MVLKVWDLDQQDLAEMPILGLYPESSGTETRGETNNVGTSPLGDSDPHSDLTCMKLLCVCREILFGKNSLCPLQSYHFYYRKLHE